ncbi:MAG: hypothetical protein JO061_07635 [Acidobacteriaceae bacterium]|nr:hypothetical protein [Acidobacteriaceae bacterium]
MPLGGIYISDPSCSADLSDSNVFCAGAGQDSQLYITEFTVGGKIPGPTGIGGVDVEGTPSCVPNPSAIQTVICTVKGGESGLHTVIFGPGYWSTKPGGKWQFLGGWVEGSPSCATAQDGSNQVICGVRGAESALHAVEFNPASMATGQSTPVWQGFASPVPVDGNPSCANLNGWPGTSSPVICSIRGTDSNLYSFAVDPSIGTFGIQQVIPSTPMQGDPACASPGNGTQQAVCALKTTGQVNFIVAQP